MQERPTLSKAQYLFSGEPTGIFLPTMILRLFDVDTAGMSVKLGTCSEFSSRATQTCAC